MLKLEIIEKRYPDRGGNIHVALSGLALSAAPGEIVCVVGPSGCGKSTLLNLIGGLDPDYRGQISFDGDPPVGKSGRGGRGGRDGVSGIGFMFQAPRLMPWLNVLDNVLLVAADDVSARKRAINLLEQMELGDVLDAYPDRLSGGMQRRVALARAFVNSPRLLLMDEPFVSLDAPVAGRLREMLLNLWQHDSATIIFVTHDLHEALALGDRVCFLTDSPGRVALDYAIQLPRPRLVDAPDVQALHAALLAQYPDLLAGRLVPRGKQDAMNDNEKVSLAKERKIVS